MGEMQQDNSIFYTKKDTGIFSELKTTAKGLTSQQAEERLHKYGLNQLEAGKKISPIKILLEQFSSPLVWILIVALGFSVFEHAYIDAIVIGVIIVLNAILGFIQEYRAERSIEALQKLASLKAKVIRNGKEVQVDSKYVVPGDILILETGDKVPADARLIEVHALQTQEGPLTGESQPVTKVIDTLKEGTPLADRKNMVYSSTIISGGRGRAVVTHTGMKTEVGKIAKLIEKAHEKQTPLQKKLRILGRNLTIAVVVVAVVVFLAGILSGNSVSEMFLTAIALAVAAIPEGLPAVITISLAIGVQQMVKRNALIRKLPSVETLGSVDVICTDKTGTLTHNEMTVRKIWAGDKTFSVTGSGYNANGKFMDGEKVADVSPLQTLLRIGSLCNDARLEAEKGKNGVRKVIGDPTEAALIVSAEKAGLVHSDLEKLQPRVDEVPFTSERKMMTTLHRPLEIGKDGKVKGVAKSGYVAYSKGAPDLLIERCDRILLDGKVVRLSREIKKKILEQNDAFASEALRVLGFAYNEVAEESKKVKNVAKGSKEVSLGEKVERNMIFVGLQAMIDPPRKEVREAIATCHKAGIRVIMITGDQISTAKAIAKELGITGKAITGKEIAEINLDSEIKEIGVFARVNPEHKLRIVEALKKQGHVVAMTGDGVNDAPALKKSDIGISMGITGTDVAKEASDMILTDDNFASIVSAVEEGRGIFDNIRKFVNYLLSSNLGEIAVILFASLYASMFKLEIGLPLTAIQILWINLVTDGLPATALGLDTHSPGIMERKPRNAKESILSGELRQSIITFGVLIGIICLVLFILYQGSGLAKAQTIVFTSLVIFELVRLYEIRTDYKIGMFTNKWLIAAVVISFGLQLVAIYTPLSNWFGTVPLGIADWGVMIVAAVVLLIVYNIIEWIYDKIVGKKR